MMYRSTLVIFSIAVLVGCAAGLLPMSSQITAHISRPVETKPHVFLGTPISELYTYILARNLGSEQANKPLYSLLRETQSVVVEFDEQLQGIDPENLNQFVLPAKPNRKDPRRVLGDEYAFELSELYLMNFASALNPAYPEIAQRLQNKGPFLIATIGQLPELGKKQSEITVVLIDFTNKDESVIPIYISDFKKTVFSLQAGVSIQDSWKAKIALFIIRLNDAIPAVPIAFASFIKALEPINPILKTPLDHESKLSK